MIKGRLAAFSSKASAGTTTRFDEARMMSEYSQFNVYKPNVQKYEDFISRYEKFPEAEKQVAYIRERLNALKKTQEGSNKIDFATGRRFRALHEAAEKESRETVGCGIFGLGCPDPLVFPEYQDGFHIKHYRRVKVNANRSSWTETGVKLDFNDVVVLGASGEVKTCNRCSNPGMQSLKNNWLLAFRIGDEEKPRQIRRFQAKGTLYTAQVGARAIGELQFLVRDWRNYPPPSSWYKDNAGSFLVDVFVFEAKHEAAFKAFREALMRANPEDEHVKASLGR